MAQGKGRGKVAFTDMKKDDSSLAGSRNNQPFTTQNTPEQIMDEYLKKIDMYRKPVAKDGSCLFRVVSEQVFNTQAVHHKVRMDCINYMHTHRKLFEEFIEGPFEHHLFNLRNLKEWGGHSEILALSLLYKYDFIVYQLANSTPQDVTSKNFGRQIRLCYLNNNHYDCVYPLSFKSDAALAQSLLYEILLDNVFAEVDKREMAAERTGECDENQDPSSWTEVKTNKSQVKPTEMSLENPWEELIAVIPESKKPQVSRALRTSLDPTIYRNIELDVWENCRWEQQKVDHVIAASYQFKPGDICIATIWESKDVSKKVVVRVQKISPEKCVVVPEDKDTQYYVPLDDLQPIVNGELSDYRALPGYYNKYESDQDFQSQKRRKHRKGRDEERKPNEFQNSKGRGGVSDFRNRGKNNNNKRVEENRNRNASPTKPQPKEGSTSKRAEKVTEQNETPVVVNSPTTSNCSVGEDGVQKVAKPAESAAAFWVRMRSNPTTPTSPVTTTANNQETTNDNAQPTKSRKSSNTSDNKPPKDTIIDLAIPKPKSNMKQDDIEGLEKLNKDIADITGKQNLKTNEKLILTSQASAKVNKVRENILMTSAKIENNISPRSSPVQENKLTNNEVKVKSPNQTKEVVNSVKTQNLAKNCTETVQLPSKSTDLPLKNSTVIQPTMTFPSKSITLPTRSTTISTKSSTIPTKTAGLPPKTTTLQQKNIAPPLKSTPSPSTTRAFSPPTIVSQTQTTTSLPTKSIASPKIATMSLKSTDVHNCNSSNDPKVIQNKPADPTVDSSLINKMEVKDEPITNTETIPMKQESSLRTPKLGKMKKKVSFGSTTEIMIEPPVTSSTLSMQPGEIHIPSNVPTTGERGKIHIPRDHIEKHMNPPAPTFHHHHHQQQYQQQPNNIHQFISSSDGGGGMPLEQIPLQPVRILPQTSYSHSPIANTIPTYYQQTTGMYPIVYRQGNLDYRANNPYQLSQDPEAKDLPEDSLVVQHFYNLGIKWCWMQQNLQRHHQQQQQQHQQQYHHHQQQQQQQVNQSGILPLPLTTATAASGSGATGHVQQVPIHHLVLNPETNRTTGELYVAKGQKPNEPSIDLQQTQQQSSVSNLQQQHSSHQLLAQSRMQQQHQPQQQQTNLPPNAFHPQSHASPQNAPFEEYETPPRLRRGMIPYQPGTLQNAGLINAPNIGHRPRYVSNRQILNGRGIIGHGPKPI